MFPGSKILRLMPKKTYSDLHSLFTLVKAPYGGLWGKKKKFRPILHATVILMDVIN